jgi:glycosyltransferase involved in cell wall biosynthesis
MSASLATTPNVSVIMPLFNERATVEAILQLVLAQPSVAEALEVDNCSTDGTFEALTNAAAAEQQLRLIRIKLGVRVHFHSFYSLSVIPYE